MPIAKLRDGSRPRRWAESGLLALLMVAAPGRIPAAAQVARGRREADPSARDTLQRRTSPSESQGSDGITWGSADGRWKGQLIGRLQFDHRAFVPTGMVPDGFSLRRIRLGASVTYATYYTFLLEGEYATGNASTTAQAASLVNGYLAFDWFRPHARIVLGQFKPQFGLENTGSDNLTDFTERALPFGLLQNLSYDRGVMVAGAPRPVPGLNYSLALTNGTGINTEEQGGNAQSLDADGKMVTARITENLASLLGHAGSVYHVGVDYKSGRAANSPSAPYSAASVQTEGRGVVFFSPEPFNAASGVTATNVDRTWTAYEVALARGPAKVQSEYWTAKYSGTRQAPLPAASYDLEVSGYYVSLLWTITGEPYAGSYRDGQFGRLRPRRDFVRAGHGLGAWQVGARYSKLDGADFGPAAPANAGRLSPPTASSTPTNGATAWSLGLTWIINPFARCLLDYVHTKFRTPITVAGTTANHEDAVVFRGQIDF